MRFLPIPLAALAFLAIGAGAHAAPYAHYSADPSRMLWFMTVSDTHIGSSGDRVVGNFTWALNDAQRIVRPRLTVACGDLTDANSLWGIPWSQQEDEWKDYRGIIDASGVTLDDFLDIPGNHDQYADKGMTYYLKHSRWGSAMNRHQHSVRVDAGFGIYHFLLAGSGENGRHLKLTSIDGLPRADVRRWLRVAAKLAREGG